MLWKQAAMMALLGGILVPLRQDGQLWREGVALSWYWYEQFTSDPIPALHHFCAQQQRLQADTPRCQVEVYLRSRQVWQDACQFAGEIRQRNHRYWRIQWHCPPALLLVRHQERQPVVWELRR